MFRGVDPDLPQAGTGSRPAEAAGLEADERARLTMEAAQSRLLSKARARQLAEANKALAEQTAVAESAQKVLKLFSTFYLRRLH